MTSAVQSSVVSTPSSETKESQPIVCDHHSTTGTAPIKVPS